jgi:UDP-2,3-diacylglucosamine pyrophosphatase LpxH
MHGLRGVSHYRSVFLSDIHLGTRGCKADLLIDFLKHTECRYLYLVGDIVDGWRLRRNWYWPEAHNEVVQLILEKARNGTRVVYVPGNHDEMLRGYFGISLGGILVRENPIHQTEDGRRMLIMHGDEFDAVVKYAKWLAVLGDHAYRFALVLNHYYNEIRRLLGYPYWSLSAWLKHRVKNAVDYIGRFEEAVAQEAARREVDGVICGHIHTAEVRMIGDVLYCNDGDWVESCTALVEQPGGKLEIVRWAEIDHRQMARSLAA